MNDTDRDAEFERMPVEEPSAGPSSEEKNMAAMAHISTFAGYVIPFGGILGPLIFFLMKKDESAYIRAHAVSALNFQISLLIWAIISGILVLIFIGVLMLLAIFVMHIVFTIIASIKASSGEYYQYPLTIRFIS